MTDLRVSGKRLRVPSFKEKHPENLESPAAAVTENDMVHLKNFLELCGFCKSNLSHDEDIYMYGYFGAFCSQKCRGKQMVCDIFKESLQNKAKAKKGRTSKESKDEILGDREMITASSSVFYI
ncbi:FCS-Like Zinc finger 16 [Cardamine amara subsp. amara]|uniref:FCS-Like Zinc finger 16 n=1 Tax=Cardamine amara subsp. amara TaxID=228776 RepID=A0ABD0ZSM9_CARAN